MPMTVHTRAHMYSGWGEQSLSCLAVLREQAQIAKLQAPHRYLVLASQILESLASDTIPQDKGRHLCARASSSRHFIP